MLQRILHTKNEAEDEVTADLLHAGHLYRISLCLQGGEVLASFWAARMNEDGAGNSSGSPVPFAYRYMTGRGAAKALLYAIGRAMLELGDRYYPAHTIVLKAHDPKRARIFAQLAKGVTRFRVDLLEE